MYSNERITVEASHECTHSRFPEQVISSRPLTLDFRNRYFSSLLEVQEPPQIR